ncbi:MAG: hypothetical protein JNM39_04160 [Bdellovibrionaceae bacterium]|nr:hypothetical protein [Pseudobdellovibrionaceae bacterium]
MKKNVALILNIVGLFLGAVQPGELAQAATTEVIQRTSTGAILLSRTTFSDGSREDYTFDPGNQYEFSKITYKYDSAGTLISIERVYDDGGRQVSYFYSSTSPILMQIQYFVPAGTLLQQKVHYKNGDLFTSDYDVNGNQPWTVRHQKVVGQVNDGNSISGGEIDFFDYRMDDGTRQIERFDRMGNQTYTKFIDYYDTLGRQDYRVMFMDNGTRVVTDYDETNTRTWKSLYKTFDQQGQLIYQDFRFDDGTRQFEGFDVDGTRSWTRYVNNFNAQGQLDYSNLYLDDGRRQVTDYDQASSESWTTLVKIFDNQGRLDVVDYRMDDGTRIYIDYDQASQYSWSERRLNFDNSGKLISQRFNNDDGTVTIK